MKSIETIGVEFINNLSSATSITELNQKILDITVGAIQSLGHVPGKFGGNAARNQIDAISKLSGGEEIEPIMKVVYGQQIVLYISAFETYLKDLTRALGNSYITIFNWNEGEKLTVETKDLIKNKVTTGDMVLSAILKKDTNFQDLQSIKRFFSNYFDIDLGLEEDIEQAYILATAMRHVIVHSNGKVDSDFLYQIRKLPKATVEVFKIDEYLPITQVDVSTTHDALMNMYAEVEASINKKISLDQE